MDVVANCFNNLCVNIVLDLAEKIPDQGSSEQNMETFISRNEFSMFLTAVDEREIVDIVLNCMGKKSNDCDEIDVVKRKW